MNLLSVNAVSGAPRVAEVEHAVQQPQNRHVFALHSFRQGHSNFKFLRDTARRFLGALNSLKARLLKKHGNGHLKVDYDQPSWKERFWIAVKSIDISKPRWPSKQRRYNVEAVHNKFKASSDSRINERFRGYSYFENNRFEEALSLLRATLRRLNVEGETLSWLHDSLGMLIKNGESAVEVFNCLTEQKTIGLNPVSLVSVSDQCQDYFQKTIMGVSNLLLDDAKLLSTYPSMTYKHFLTHEPKRRKLEPLKNAVHELVTTPLKLHSNFAFCLLDFSGNRSMHAVCDAQGVKSPDWLVLDELQSRLESLVTRVCRELRLLSDP